MKLSHVVVNGRFGLAVGIGSGPNAGKRAVLWDDADVIDWVPTEDVQPGTLADML